MHATKILTLALAITTSFAIGLPAPSLAVAAVTAPKPPSKPKKLTLVGLDNGVTFTAQIQPKEIHVEKTVPWSKSKTSTGDKPELEFTSAQGRTMTFELVFDTSEAKTDVHEAYIAKLMTLATIMDPNGAEEKKRPTRVKVLGIGAITFEGVIESLSVKYTMFSADGTPVRATCTVKVKEASRASFRRGSSGAG